MVRYIEIMKFAKTRPQNIDIDILTFYDDDKFLGQDGKNLKNSAIL